MTPPLLGITAKGAPAKRHLQHPQRRDVLGRPLSYCANAWRPDLLTTNAAEMTCGSCRSVLYGRRTETTR